MRASFLLYLFSFSLLFACSKQQPEASSYEYLFRGGDLPEGAELTVEGESIGALGRNRTLMADIPAATFMTDPARRIVARAPSTCGVLEIPLISLTRDRTREESDRRMGMYSTIELGPAENAPVFRRIELLIDNTGGEGPVTLRVGDSEATVEGEKLRTHVLVGPCDDGGAVMVGQTLLGHLPELGPDDAVLIDLSGEHCYVHQVVNYERDPAAATDVPPPPDHLSARHLHALTRPGYFLGAAPDFVQSRSGSTARSELLHEPCGG